MQSVPRHVIDLLTSEAIAILTAIAERVAERLAADQTRADGALDRE